MPSFFIANGDNNSVGKSFCIIGDSGNAASIGLHQALGFTPAGIAPAMGYKFGRWVDLVWMTRPLGPGRDSPPDAPGLRLSGV